MKKRDQPHDRYFKDLMQDIALAKEFLQIYLAKDIQEHIAWDTLTPYDTSLIGARDKQLYADVVYKALTKDHRAAIFFVLNHERKPDELLPVKMLEYTLATLRKTVKQQQGKPAFIIQLTLYNGQTHPYPYARSVVDYFGNRELARKILFDTHQVIDLHAYPDEVLASHKQLSVLELFMKHADNPALPKWIEANPQITKKLASHKYIERSLRYISDAGYHRIEALLNSLGKVSEKLKEDMLTTTRQIERRAERRGKQLGRQEGRQEGIQTRSLEIARNMLFNLHLGMDIVQKATGLSREELNKLQVSAQA